MKNLNSGSKIKIMFGLNSIFNLLQNPAIQQKLKDTLNFDYPDFFKLTGKFDLFEIFHRCPTLPEVEAVKEKNLITFPIWGGRRIKICKLKNRS